MKYLGLSVALILISAAQVFGQWVDITDQLPEHPEPPEIEEDGDNEGDFWITPTFNVPSSINKLFHIEGSIIVTRAFDILISANEEGTFHSTNAPFSVYDPFVTVLLSTTPRQSPVQYITRRGKLFALAHNEISHESNTGLYQLDTTTGTWEKQFDVIPDYNRDAYGEIEFYDYCEFTDTHFIVTKLRKESESSSSRTTFTYHSYMWQSQDGTTWHKVESDELPLPALDQFFCSNGKIYAPTGHGVLESSDQGSTWQLQIQAGQDNRQPYISSFATNGQLYNSRLYPWPSIFFDDEVGIHTDWRLLDLDTLSIDTHVLPIDGILEVSKHGSYTIVVGSDSFEIDYLHPAYFSSNKGITWDRINLDGIELYKPLTEPFYFNPYDGLLWTFLLSDDQAYTVAHDKLWRRPRSELDLRRTTQIITEPDHTVANAGDPVTLTIDAVGEGELIYQWYKDDVAISGANAYQLSIPELSASDKGDYHVTVQGERGEVTSRKVRVDVMLDFESFAALNFPTGRRAPEDDANGNGISNLQEFYFGPNTKDPASTKTIQKGQDLGLFTNDEEFLTLTVRRRINAEGSSLNVQAAPTLAELNAADPRAKQVGSSHIEGDFEVITFRSTFNTDDSPSGFIRAVIE